MALSKKISGCLLLVLLFLFSNNDVAPPCSGAANYQSEYTTLRSGHDKAVVSITKHTVLKDWIKVRYKGGETPIFDTAAHIPVVSLLIAGQTKRLSYVPFISLPYYFSYKLRGPPTGLS